MCIACELAWFADFDSGEFFGRDKPATAPEPVAGGPPAAKPQMGGRKPVAKETPFSCDAPAAE